MSTIPDPVSAEAAMRQRIPRTAANKSTIDRIVQRTISHGRSDDTSQALDEKPPDAVAIESGAPLCPICSRREGHAVHLTRTQTRATEICWVCVTPDCRFEGVTPKSKTFRTTVCPYLHPNRGEREADRLECVDDVERNKLLTAEQLATFKYMRCPEESCNFRAKVRYFDTV